MSNPQEPLSPKDYANLNACWLEDTRDAQPVGVLTLKEVLEWIGEHLRPEQVFSERDLQDWAISSDYVTYQDAAR
jgi:hypothetical protein